MDLDLEYLMGKITQMMTQKSCLSEGQEYPYRMDTPVVRVLMEIMSLIYPNLLILCLCFHCICLCFPAQCQ